MSWQVHVYRSQVLSVCGGGDAARGLAPSHADRTVIPSGRLSNNTHNSRAARAHAFDGVRVPASDASHRLTSIL